MSLRYLFPPFESLYFWKYLKFRVLWVFSCTVNELQGLLSRKIRMASPFPEAVTSWTTELNRSRTSGDDFYFFTMIPLWHKRRDLCFWNIIHLYKTCDNIFWWPPLSFWPYLQLCIFFYLLNFYFSQFEHFSYVSLSVVVVYIQSVLFLGRLSLNQDSELILGFLCSDVNYHLKIFKIPYHQTEKEIKYNNNAFFPLFFSNSLTEEVSFLSFNN